MPISAARAFVLGTIPFSEQDKLVHLLTDNKGILKAIAPGALKNKNRFGSLLELFTEIEFQYYWQEEKELITLSKGDMVKSYFHIVSDSSNIFYFYLLAEILLRFVPHNYVDNRIYRLVRTFLENRANGVDINLLLLYFLVWILRIEGMMFKPGICYNCYTKGIHQAWMKTDYRGILCSQCKTDEKIMLTSSDLQFLAWTEKHAPPNIGIWKDKIDCPKLIRIFKQKIEYHGELNLKTSQYLPEFI
ncbi:MAG: DNA repair protein RecO [Acidobacteria bacterium]|nr:DNA repair protein RecO [Acidobacteriota bacterium]